MKRVVAVTVITVFITALTATSSIVIHNIHNSLTKEVEIIEQLYYSGNITDNDIKVLEEKWNKAESVLLIFANHNALEEIKINLKRFSCAAKEKNSSSFFAEAEELKCRLNILKENESFSPNSIF